MKTSVKNIIVTLSFMGLLCGFMLTNIILPDKELSLFERRRLMRAPEYSSEKLISGQLFMDYEKYFLDQFVLRDGFRGIKAFTRLYVLGQRDNNGVYLVGNGIYKMEYPLKENSVYNAAAKLNQVYDQYLEGMNVYYAVIPDKNYFVAEAKGYLGLDYDRMLEIMEQNVRHMTYIDIFGSLSISDYYRTDIHWRQEGIIDVADLLLAGMGVDGGRGEFTKLELYPFYGSYYGQAALPIAPDRMVYLTNAVLEKVTVYDFARKEYSEVCTLDLFAGVDPYNIFLGGASPLLSLENPACTSGRELILFRDSFGSSIAPLLIEGYSKIIMVDLRYITTGLLGDYIEFNENQDVLFLYSTPVLNNSAMLR